MPYIKKEARVALEKYPLSIEDAGELNYEITKVITRYLRIKGLRYRVINDVIGALEGAKLEFYRRVAVPYEDSKIQENGDVY
jgi:hypothetical protein